jgi:hypothetical protein
MELNRRRHFGDSMLHWLGLNLARDGIAQVRPHEAD